jgi:hypothetical protein
MKNFLITAFVGYVLWIVIYLLWEYFSRRKNRLRKIQEPPFENPNQDDIIGKSTFVMRQSMPQAATAENQKNGTEKEDSFAASSETKPPVKVPDNELDKSFSHNQDDNQPMNISVPLEYENDDEYNPKDDEDDTWLAGNTSLAEGSTFEEMGATIWTVVHYNKATLPEKEQAGGILLKIRQTDMFEQLVQSAPRREDQVSQAINLHLADFYRRMAEKDKKDEKNNENGNAGYAPGKSDVPADFNMKDFV